MLEPIAPPAAGSGVAGGSVPVVVEQPVDPEDSSHRYRVHRGAIARGGKTIAPEAFRRDLFVLVLDSQGQPLGKKQGSQRRIPIQRTIDMSLICEARIPTRHDDLVILIEIFDRIPTFKCDSSRRDSKAEHSNEISPARNHAAKDPGRSSALYLWTCHSWCSKGMYQKEQTR